MIDQTLACVETYWQQMACAFVFGAVIAGMIAAAAWPQEIKQDEHAKHGGIGA